MNKSNDIQLLASSKLNETSEITSLIENLEKLMNNSMT